MPERTDLGYGFCLKNYQNTQIFIIFARKINEIPEFYVILPEKCPDFKYCPKNIFPNFGGHMPILPSPLSPAPVSEAVVMFVNPIPVKLSLHYKSIYLLLGIPLHVL